MAPLYEIIDCITPYEKEAIVQYILDLDSRGFPPRPRDVQEMADLLFAERDASPVGKNWATVNRRASSGKNHVE
jgi:Tc5 transposase DNA-binding domain